MSDAIALLPDTAEGLDHYYGDAPHGVRANMIFTLDGAAAFQGRTKAISDPNDQQLLIQLRSYADVILVGSGTVGAESYGPVRLPDALRERRAAAGAAELPRLAVVTGRGLLSPALRIFEPGAPKPLVVSTAHTAKEHPELADLGDIVVAGERAVDPVTMLAELRGLGLERVLCEGGPYLLSTLVDADLVDDMCVTIAPFVAGVQPTSLAPMSSRRAPARLRMRHALQRNGMLYLRYSRALPPS